MADQTTPQNPVDQYAKPPFPKQVQDETGLAGEMSPKPDHGEKSYKGFGRLNGKTALITGADSGIGRAVAIAFAREGADIAMNYLIAEEKDAREVVELIRAEGRKVICIPGDLSDELFCKTLIEKTVTDLGGLDILANIAGKQISQDHISSVSTKQFDETFKVNIYALFWMCKYAIPHLRMGASIINTTSIQAYQPSENLLDSASTKAAINAFTKSLAKQIAKDGIRVNAVAPGPIWTPLQPSHGQPQEKLQHFGEQTPLGRPGQPAEVAPLYVFLASQESSYITAETIGVTGGQHLP